MIQGSDCSDKLMRAMYLEDAYDTEKAEEEE